MVHLCLLCRNAFCTFFQIVVVVASVGIELLVGKLYDAVADAVEEVAVVRHHQQGHRPAAVQVVLQPLHHLQVEVVGRLVEYQQLRVVDQHVCQCQAFLLPTTQLSHLLFEVCDVQAAQDACQLRTVGQHLLPVLRLIHHPFVATAHAAANLPHRDVRWELRVLAEVFHPQVVAPHDGAFVLPLDAHDDVQQRRLAAAVAGYEADAVTLTDAQRKVLEKHQVAERLGKIINLEVADSHIIQTSGAKLDNFLDNFKKVEEKKLEKALFRCQCTHLSNKNIKFVPT